MENVLLDRSSGSLEFPKRSLGRSRRGLGGARPAPPPPAGAYSSFPTWQPPYNHLQKGGGWTSATVLPYARPPLYSSPSLPLLPSSQPPLLPLPPTATKYTTFPCLLTAAPPPPPPEAAPRRGTAVTVTTTVPVPAAAAPRTRERRRRPARPPSTAETPSRAQKKKPLERATPLPPAPVVTEALDDLEQEVARNFVQDLLHVLAPPPSSLPLPSFSLVMKAASSPATATAPRVVGAPVVAPSCNVEAATADGISGLLRL